MEIREYELLMEAMDDWTLDYECDVAPKKVASKLGRRKAKLTKKNKSVRIDKTEDLIDCDVCNVHHRHDEICDSFEEYYDSDDDDLWDYDW